MGQVDQHIELPGRGITYVRDSGGPPAWPVLILLHGLGATGRLNWGPSFRALAGHFRVISIDQRGHGRGIETRRFHLHDCADDVVALADVLDIDEFVPVGYSMGGPVAQLVWARHPDRVAGLVLCATARNFGGRPWASPVLAAIPGLAFVARATPESLKRRAMAALLARVSDPADRDRVLDEMGRNDPAVLIEAAGCVARFTSHEWIGDVDVPTAVVVTAQDRVVPPNSQRKLAAAISTACAFEVPGDHAVCIAGPERFVPVLVQACTYATASATGRWRGGPVEVGNIHTGVAALS